MIKIIYEICFSDGNRFNYDNLRSAIRELNELVEVFEVTTADVSAYARAYDRFGNLIDEARFF